MKDFPEIYLVTTELKTVSSKDVRLAELELKTSFPHGYTKYITELGLGLFCDYLYVYPPQRVLDEFKLYQNLFREYFHLWNDSLSLITEEDIGQLIVFAHTIDMDKVAFHTQEPKQIFVIPYDNTFIHQVDSNIPSLLDWIYDYGISEQTSLYWFNSEMNQAYLKMKGQNVSLDLSDKFQIFACHLGWNWIRSSIRNTEKFFVRELNGCISISTNASHQTKVFLEYDKNNLAAYDKVKDFFLQNDLMFNAEGQKQQLSND